ncbi:hypothetical protein HDU87_005404 [Geranomyces variabilis]|uniref:FAM192A/Fyv6 N-terminal domain-containing protein n=1 Tax=Geranomyces variabilis TaxID=109894 RepID=A0AAD5TJ72_9FUNG|nr:hypothetical protein HDU87_005404 [Geranomyces variabilis]
MSAFGAAHAPANPAAELMASRFATQEEVESKRAEREAEAKAEGREYVEKVEIFDPRPLYDQLADKKRIAEEEFAEKMKFSNLVHRLDDDEYEFLSSYDSENARKNKEIAQETKVELDAFRKAVSEVAAVPLGGIPDSSIVVPPPPPPPLAAGASKGKDFQKKAFEGLVVRKRKVDGADVKEEKDAAAGEAKRPKVEHNSTAGTKASARPAAAKPKSPAASRVNPLASLVAYSDNSDSD